jgi:hypothetical protein
VPDDITPGYIPSVRTPTDYIKGVNSPLLGAVLPVFDWRLVRPILDLQKKNGFESFGCVSWSAVQDIEELLGSLVQMNMVPGAHLDFLNENGYISDGRVVLSKAFIWVQSGTLQNFGNNFPKVADAVRQYGLIPETLFPFNPPAGANWQQVFVPPTQAMLAAGSAFLQLFDVGYHFLTDGDFGQHLQDGPVQIAIPACPGYGQQTPVAACNAPSNHCVLIDFVDGQGVTEIVDHYDPEIKFLSNGYSITEAIQYVVTVKTP